MEVEREKGGKTRERGMDSRLQKILRKILGRVYCRSEKLYLRNPSERGPCCDVSLLLPFRLNFQFTSHVHDLLLHLMIFQNFPNDGKNRRDESHCIEYGFIIHKTRRYLYFLRISRKRDVLRISYSAGGCTLSSLRCTLSHVH